jgi:hypothetical protein
MISEQSMPDGASINERDRDVVRSTSSDQRSLAQVYATPVSSNVTALLLLRNTIDDHLFEWTTQDEYLERGYLLNQGPSGVLHFGLRLRSRLLNIRQNWKPWLM